MVERQPSKLIVAGSSPVRRSTYMTEPAGSDSGRMLPQGDVRPFVFASLRRAACPQLMPGVSADFQALPLAGMIHTFYCTFKQEPDFLWIAL